MIKGIGKVCQIGYVVKDIDEALEFWVNVMGVGPWFINPSVKPDNYMYRGKPSHLDMKTALANSEEMQLELIQDCSKNPTFYQEFLDAGTNGIHHVSIWQKSKEDFEYACQQLSADGFVETQSGYIRGPDGKFAYYENKEKYPGVIIELSMVFGAKGEKFKMIADAAKNWDGKDPIR